MYTHNLQIRIRRCATSLPDLELVGAPRPKLTNGSFMARALWLALDPFLCASADVAHDGARPGDLVPAPGVGEVIESRHEVFGVGSLVVFDFGLQQLCVSDGEHARLLHPGQTPASSALGVLGAPGMAAYFGLLDLARLRAGETVLVSAAANAAGAMAGQIAMLKGARAIGIAGTREKCDWVMRHARLSACINHRTENLNARLRALAPRGVDIYFDNTGGEVLETIIAGRHLASGARILQHSVKPAEPQALLARGGYRDGSNGSDGVRVLRVKARDYEHRRGEFLREAIAWHGAGRIAAKDHVVEGLANAPAHLLLAMQGGNFGRPLVRM
jgi:NADPH-dependent curcumin reductase CurA